jgi:nickel/cobalt transporter (NiCoT) family protein
MLTPAERRRAAGLAAAILALHVAGFGLLIGSGELLGAGIGITAYTLGLRHAFDADHIGAIDNTTRKLMGEGQRPLSVGFFFSLGHSTVVFALAALIALGTKGIAESARVHEVTGVIGPAVSGTFLIAIGLLNLRGLTSGGEPRGVMLRVYARATRAITRPWQMYPLGCLFGLGFDTATEVALLAAAGGAAAGGLPWYAILCLPILFAAGMSLLDTIDGAFMNFAYGWAFAKPVRKIYYNITITALSVAVALIIGSIELIAVFSDKLSLTGGVWDFVAGIDLNYVGYAIVGAFALTWAIALAVWHWGRIEEKWSANLTDAPAVEERGAG